MTAWTCPICAGRTCAAASPCGDVWSGRAQATRLPRAGLASVQNAPAPPAPAHGTSEGSKTPPTPPSVAGAGKPAPVGGPTFWQPAPGPTSATTLERLTADNQALTEQVTRLQEASNARLALARIRKVLELPEGTSDQELIDEVARIRGALIAVWGGTTEPKPTIDRTAFVNGWSCPGWSRVVTYGESAGEAEEETKGSASGDRAREYDQTLDACQDIEIVGTSKGGS